VGRIFVNCKIPKAFSLKTVVGGPGGGGGGGTETPPKQFPTAIPHTRRGVFRRGRGGRGGANQTGR